MIAVQRQDLDDSVREGIIEHMKTMAGEGLRTIALAYHDLADVEIVRALEDAPTEDMQMTFIALIGIRDPPRKVALHTSLAVLRSAKQDFSRNSLLWCATRFSVSVILRFSQRSLVPSR